MRPYGYSFKQWQRVVLPTVRFGLSMARALDPELTPQWEHEKLTRFRLARTDDEVALLLAETRLIVGSMIKERVAA